MHILLFFLLFILPWPAQATIYRCNTAAGISFQEQPCADSAVSNIVEIDDYRIGSRAVPVKKLKPKKKSRRRSKPKRRTAGNNKKACFSKKQQLKKVQWTLRRGYKAGKGAKLRQRRRTLKDYLREFCS